MRCTSCLLGLVLAAACTGDDPMADPPMAPKCLEGIDPTGCTPAYPAQFERIMSETMLPICGVSGGSCHGEAGAAGAVNGLVITDDLDATHATLLEGFVKPGDVTCSEVTVRTHLDAGDKFLMPPGVTPLDDGILCSITQWVAAGAPR